LLVKEAAIPLTYRLYVGKPHDTGHSTDPTSTAAMAELPPYRGRRLSALDSTHVVADNPALSLPRFGLANRRYKAFALTPVQAIPWLARVHGRRPAHLFCAS